jgi:hypothetical protein
MRKADLALLAEDDAPPDDDVAKGANKHRMENCPFCGGAVGAAVAVQITSGTKPDFAVRCQNCDAQGPWGLSARIAAELWNFGFQASRAPAGRRARKQSQPTTKPARGGTAD